MDNAYKSIAPTKCAIASIFSKANSLSAKIPKNNGVIVAAIEIVAYINATSLPENVKFCKKYVPAVTNQLPQI